MTSKQENCSGDDRAAHELLNILRRAHAVLDAREPEHVPPEQRRRHIPRHHPAWHQ